MRIRTDEVVEQMRRENPEQWRMLEQMLSQMPSWVTLADATGDIPEGYWAVAPVDLQNRINLPPEYGGSPLTATAIRRALLFERIGRLCPALPIGLPGPGLSTPPVGALATDEQKAAYFRRFVGQERPVWGAFAITEPQGGSDATAMRTTATRRGDHYVLNGNKCFITNGKRADVLVVFATIEPSKGRFGIRAFVVPKETPGFTVDRCEVMLGLRASQLAALSFTECAVPIENMLGHTGRRGPLIDAFAGAQGAWDCMRPVVSSLINGSCYGILEYAEGCIARGEATLTRRETEAARENLRVFRARVDAGRLLVLRAAWKYDNGQQASVDGSMAKACASTVAMEIAHYLTALFPLKAIAVGDPIEKFYRDAKAFDILEGTGDMQRLMVARGYNSASA